jgi:hypothetical protein
MDNRDIDNELTDLALAILCDKPFEAAVQAGADSRGLDRETVDQMAAQMFEAGSIANDRSVEPRRRALCRQVALDSADILRALARVGRAVSQGGPACAS